MNELAYVPIHPNRPLSIEWNKPKSAPSYPLERAAFVHSSGHDYKWLYFNCDASSTLQSFALYETKSREIEIALVFKKSAPFENYLREKGFISKWNSSTTRCCTANGEKDLFALYKMIIENNSVPKEFEKTLLDAVVSNPADLLAMNPSEAFLDRAMKSPYPADAVEMNRSLGDWTYISSFPFYRFMEFTAVWPASTALQSFNIYGYKNGEIKLRVEITEYYWGKGLRDYLTEHGFPMIKDSFARMGTVYVEAMSKKEALALYQIISCHNYFPVEDLKKLNQIFAN